jgi:peptide/nickel transport system substrate-binding protein
MTVMVAAQGLDLAVPTAKMAPTELAPMMQTFYAWPKWGQYVETKGKNGEACDVAEAKHLLALYERWMATADEASTSRSGARCSRTTPRTSGRSARSPVRSSRSSPGTGSSTYRRRRSTAGSRAPCSGVYRVDEFYWDKAAGKEASLAITGGRSE